MQQIRTHTSSIHEAIYQGETALAANVKSHLQSTVYNSVNFLRLDKPETYMMLTVSAAGCNLWLGVKGIIAYV